MKEREKVKHDNAINNPIVVFVFTIIFSLSALVFSRIGFHTYDKIVIDFTEKKDIDYKVYLKENNFFEDKFLPKNKTYITSLIDYIDVEFDYGIDLTDEVSGEYSYTIKAFVEANNSNSKGNYFSKEYILKESEKRDYKSIDKLNVKDSFKIDYQEYNDMLLAFKNQFGVSTEGNLKVGLFIHNTIRSVEPNIAKESALELNIPLTTLTVEVPIVESTKAESGTLYKSKEARNSIFYNTFKIVGVIFFVIAFLFALKLINFVIIGFKLEGKYQRKLRKILKTYDEVIVNVKNLPKVNLEKAIFVANFEELIDAHEEIRNPINYYSNSKGALFLLIQNDYCYCYKIKREWLISNEEENIK